MITMRKFYFKTPNTKAIQMHTFATHFHLTHSLLYPTIVRYGYFVQATIT
jgi:hypothetical protein